MYSSIPPNTHGRTGRICCPGKGRGLLCTRKECCSCKGPSSLHAGHHWLVTLHTLSDWLSPQDWHSVPTAPARFWQVLQLGPPSSADDGDVVELIIHSTLTIFFLLIGEFPAPRVWMSLWAGPTCTVIFVWWHYYLTAVLSLMFTGHLWWVYTVTWFSTNMNYYNECTRTFFTSCFIINFFKWFYFTLES